MCSVQSPLGDPQQPHGCSRNVPSAASAGCLPCALFLVFAFASSTEKASLERAAGFSRLAQDEAILLRALSQKRVLKFKPRGAGLPSSPLGEEPLSPFLTVFSQSVSWQARTTMIFPPLFFFLLSSPSLFSSPLTRLLSASPEVFPNFAKSSGNSGSARRGGRARRPAPRAAGRSLWPRRGGTRRVPTSAGPWAKRPGLWGAAGSAPPRSLSNSRKKSWEDPSLQGPKRGCAPRRGSAPGRAAHGPRTRSPPDPRHPSSPMGTAAHGARTSTRRAPGQKGDVKTLWGQLWGGRKAPQGVLSAMGGRWVRFAGGETEAERGCLESPWPLLAQGRGWCEIGALPSLAQGGGILVARTHTCSPPPRGAGR